LLGTIDYMSPEQASNPRNADHRSDIYSLGCTLHYLLTGRPPYSGETLMERLIAHREQPIPSFSDSLRAVSPSLDGLLRRVLAKSPTDRFSTLDELIAGLEACLPRPLTDTTERPAPQIATDPLKPSGKRRTTFAVVILGIAAAVGLLLTVITLSRPGSVPTGKVPLPVSATAVIATTETVREPKPKSPELQRSALKPDEQRPAPKTMAIAPAPPIPAKAILPVDAVGLVREFRGHVRRVNGIAVSGDGLLALSGGQDRTVRLWDVATGNELLRVDHDGPVDAVAITVDGRRGLSGSEDKTVRLWDFRPENTVGMRRLDGHTKAVYAVAFALGDQIAVSGGADKTIRVWDLATGQVSGSPLLHESTVVALATTRGDDVLAGCDDGTLWLWDL
jgi:hypothetical protein